jgi:hypothetical protein
MAAAGRRANIVLCALCPLQQCCVVYAAGVGPSVFELATCCRLQVQCVHVQAGSALLAAVLCDIVMLAGHRYCLGQQCRNCVLFTADYVVSGESVFCQAVNCSEGWREDHRQHHIYVGS